jgi:hypothetical protein
LAGQSSAVVMKKLELRNKALAANSMELPHLEGHRQIAVSMLTEMKDLTAQQASLTAAKQDISKRLETLKDEGRKLLTFVDVGVRQHYGTRSEKLVEFGQQPFRSQPRIRVVGEDGKPLAKRPPAPPQPPAPPLTE